MQLQKSAGSILTSNKLARSAPKRVAVRVNRGLGGAASDTRVSGSVSIETIAGVSACAVVKRCMIGLDPGRRLNVVQRSSHSPKAVWRSWDRGHKSHRILRRVLVGGRHLRTSRAIGFHESVVKATLAASSRGKGGADSSRELDVTAQRQGEGAAAIPRKRERRQRCQRHGL